MARRRKAADVSSRSKSIGPGGFALLGVAALAGIALGVHGWSTRHTCRRCARLDRGWRGHRRPQALAPAPPRDRQHGPLARPRPPASTPGPLLSSQSYAQYAFQIWPGRLSPAARAAETGLAVTVRGQGNGLEVSAGVSGQPASAPQLYPAGARVFVIEAALGEDSGTEVTTQPR